MTNTLYIITPCCNEEKVLPITALALKGVITQLKSNKSISADSRILFVDDGSTDNTWSAINHLCSTEPESYCGVKLSRNFGQQSAILAGIKEGANYADFVITLDADLQDDINVINEMIDQYNQGSDIVYGVREDRSNDTGFKRNSADIFYKLMNFLGAPLIYNHADYRLMSKRALVGLFKFSEANLFLRGIVPLIGYKSEIVKYDRKKRAAGETKYPTAKMVSFAWEGITSLGAKLFKLVIGVGVAILLVSILMFFFALSRSILGIGGNWILVSVWFLMGLQIVFIGVVGEYLSKVYLETKRRPSYIIDEIIKDGVSDVILESFEEDFMI